MQQPPQYPYPQIAPPPPKPPGRLARFWRWYRAQTRTTQIIVGLGIVVGIIFVLSAAISGGVQGAQQALAPTPTVVVQPTPTDTPAPLNIDTPTTVPAPQAAYPPKTKADLQALAALGDASVIHEFHSESVGAVGACPEPMRLVTVDPSITGKKLAEDLLAYFYANQLENACGTLVGAYHNQSESNDVYTAGRILLDVTNQDGSANFDPNATGLKYTLTLDVGGDLTNQPEYIVSWTS